MGNHTEAITDWTGAAGISKGTSGQMVSDSMIRYGLIAIYIIPLLVIAYLYVQYIYPMFTAAGEEVMALGVSAVLTLAVILSILGLALMSKSAKASCETLMSINQRMDGIMSVAKRFEESGHVDVLVDSVARSAKDVLNAEASSLLLYDPDGNLRFEYVEGPAAHILKGKCIKPGEGVAGWAALEKKAVILNDVKKDKRFAKMFDKESGFTTRSVICMPLAFGNHDLGVIEVINKRGGGFFTEIDMQTLCSLSEHAAAAIYRNKNVEDMKNDFIQVMEFLIMAMDNTVPDKKGHSRRVAKHSVKLAKGLGLKEEDVRQVYFGAMLHDIGLLRLDVNEYQDREKFRMHSSVGAEMVKKVNQWRSVADMIRDHHERYDGGGYPSGLTGDAISLGGRIIALAESLDVMTSSSSYKMPVSFDEASNEIRSLAGFQFDPDIVDVFVETFSSDDLPD